MCTTVSLDVNELCERYMRELRRRVYTTPKSYLDHIKLYQALLLSKRGEI
jgi:dynein heavy chain